MIGSLCGKSKVHRVISSGQVAMSHNHHQWCIFWLAVSTEKDRLTGQREQTHQKVEAHWQGCIKMLTLLFYLLCAQLKDFSLQDCQPGTCYFSTLNLNVLSKL